MNDRAARPAHLDDIARLLGGRYRALRPAPGQRRAKRCATRAVLPRLDRAALAPRWRARPRGSCRPARRGCTGAESARGPDLARPSRALAALACRARCQGGASQHAGSSAACGIEGDREDRALAPRWRGGVGADDELAHQRSTGDGGDRRWQRETRSGTARGLRVAQLRITEC